MKQGLVLAGILLAIGFPVLRLLGASDVTDVTIPPGGNYDKAEFRLWYPADSATLRAVAVLMPGSNGDGRAMAEETGWQEFATKNHVALVGCRITDKP